MSYRNAPLEMLQVGAKLQCPIRDAEGKLLLGPGVVVTQDFLVALFKRGVRSVAVDARDWTRLNAFTSHGRLRTALPDRQGAQTSWNAAATRDLDATIAGYKSPDIKPSENAFTANLKQHGAEGYTEEGKARVFELHCDASSRAADIAERLRNGEAVTADSVQQITRTFLMQAAEDMDLFVCMGINPAEDHSIFAHSTNVASLAIAIGATLGLDAEALCDLGTGCLVNDAGMLHVDPELLEAGRSLTSSEFVDIAKHPIIGADLLYKHMERVPVAVRMIVYQMHERCDGSGYPRGCTADQIHPLAKIAAVADVYVALVSRRPHRHALMPYYAMAKLLEGVRAGLYDATVVRALLCTISLFPIGSYLELGKNEVAKVVRANGPVYDKPVVETWLRSRRYDAPRIVDLTTAEQMALKPISSLA